MVLATAHASGSALQLLILVGQWLAPPKSTALFRTGATECMAHVRQLYVHFDPNFRGS